MFDFGNQWVSRVCARALVVEGVFCHLVECFEEFCFFDAVVANRLFDADAHFEVVNGGDEVIEFFVVVSAAQAECVGDLCISL